jgi:hypothetical protein
MTLKNVCVLSRQARFLERERAELVVSDNVKTCRCSAATKSIPSLSYTAQFRAQCADVADTELVPRVSDREMVGTLA